MGKSKIKYVIENKVRLLLKPTMPKKIKVNIKVMKSTERCRAIAYAVFFVLRLRKLQASFSPKKNFRFFEYLN